MYSKIKEQKRRSSMNAYALNPGEPRYQVIQKTIEDLCILQDFEIEVSRHVDAGWELVGRVNVTEFEGSFIY